MTEQTRAAAVVQALRIEIEARGLTQLEVDHRAGLSEGHCSAILNGKRIPKVDTLLKLLDAIGLDLAFVQGSGEPTAPAE